MTNTINSIAALTTLAETLLVAPITRATSFDDAQDRAIAYFGDNYDFDHSRITDARVASDLVLDLIALADRVFTHTNSDGWITVLGVKDDLTLDFVLEHTDGKFTALTHLCICDDQTGEDLACMIGEAKEIFA